MTEYLQVARHLGVVRRAWKRAAALAGLAIVCIESIGILTVALLIDWVYQPMPAVRLLIFVAVVAAIAFLSLRHVFAPMMRRISRYLSTMERMWYASPAQVPQTGSGLPVEVV